MDGTILGQGSFIVPATVINQVIQIPSGADWLSVVNYTQMGTVGTGSTYNGFEYFWQRGMAAGSATVKFYADTDTIMSGDTIATGGFTLYDPSGQTAGAQALVGPAVVTSASTNAVRPVVSTSNTTGLVVGSVVRMSNTAQTDVNGIDMVVGAVSAGSSFTLLTASNPLATAPGAIGGAGFYRIVNTQSLFYPRRRTVTNVTKATNAQVSTSLEHSLTVGQSVRFVIPTVSGMTQLNSSSSNNYLTATVVSIVDAYNFTINVDTTSFTTFTWPTIAQQPSGFPEMVPVGEDTAVGLTANNNVFPQYRGLNVYNANSGILADSTVNTGFLGMIMGTGGLGTANTGLTITGPAGSAASDVVYWRAGKSTYGGL